MITEDDLPKKKHDTDIVQFACPMYYCDEAEGFVTIEVMRLGDLEGEVTVSWETEDVSGKSGDRYVGSTGDITFRDKEAHQSIRVDILVLPLWCPTLEFRVRLTDPENCYLGMYLQICTVKVIDDDCFPSNKYADVIMKETEGVRNVNPAGLFIEFVMMVYQQRGIHWRTAVILVFDQLQNLYLFLKLWMSAYLVNVVLDNDGDHGTMILPNNREGTAAIIGVLYIVPFVSLHIWSFVKIRMDIQGLIHVFLSTCLFRKYLNYSESSRQYVFPAEMQLGLLNETKELSLGYVLLLDLMQLIGRSLILLAFVLLKEPKALWIVILMPTLIIIFGLCRGNAVGKYRREKDNRERELIGIIAQTCDKYLTIRHYFRRSSREEMFRKKADDTRLAEVPETLALNNNLYAAEWLGPIFTGLYICLSAPHVIAGDLELGNFLATISIMASMSSLFVTFYSNYQRLSEMSEPLNTLAVYYNLPTDLREFKKATEDELKWMRAARKDVMAGPRPPREQQLMRTDMIPIILDGLTFSYKADRILKNVNLQVAQGRTVAITGIHGCGKATLLKLLSKTMTCHSGNVFIPPHLRVLFVSQDPCILRDLSLWENLTMGCPNGVDQAMMNQVLQDMDMVRVIDAMEHFRDGPKMVQTAQDALTMEHSNTAGDEDTLLDKGAADATAEMQHKKKMAKWYEKLNYSEQAKIHLARAFIMNPEVMVMHRPVSHFDEEIGKIMLDLIRQHSKNRGLAMPSATLGRRRPRTVFMTTESEWQEGIADIRWNLNHKTRSIDEMDANAYARSSTVLLPQAAPPMSASSDARRSASSDARSQANSQALENRHCSNSWMRDLCFTPGRRDDVVNGGHQITPNGGNSSAHSNLVDISPKNLSR